MARWHLTSSEAIHGRASRLCDAAGLAAAGEWTGAGLFIRTYAKRAVPGANFARMAGDDWIAVAGTLLHEQALGGDALRGVYEAFARSGDDARAGFLGHYAAAVKLGGQVHVFTDPQGSLALYYGSRGGDHVITNSLQLAAASLGAGEVEPLALLNYVLNLESVGPRTFFPGIRRLFGGERLVIDAEDGTMTVVPVHQGLWTLGPAAKASAGEAVDEYVRRVRGVFDQLAGVPSVGLNATGGLDTRTVLAALLDRGIRPRLLTGVGNSRLTSTRAQDLEAATSLASDFDLPFQQMDWSGMQPHSREHLRALFWRYGFPYTTYGAADSFLRGCEGAIDPYPTLMLGGYSPAFTNMKVWEQASGRYGLDDVVDHYLLRPDPAALEPEVYADYRRHVAAEAREALARSPVDVSADGFDAATFVQARLFLYLRPESIAANFFNEFGYYLAPFLTKQLYDPLLTIPLEYRKGDAFQLRVIHALCPSCLATPVFSGQHAQIVDLAAFTMTRASRVASAPAALERRGSGPVGSLARRVLPSSLRRRLRALGGGPPASAPRATATSASPPGSRQEAAPPTRDDLIRADSAAAVKAHPMGALTASLDSLDLVRLHRLHLTLVGIDELEASRPSTAGSAPPGPRGGGESPDRGDGDGHPG